MAKWTGWQTLNIDDVLPVRQGWLRYADGLPTIEHFPGLRPSVTADSIFHFSLNLYLAFCSGRVPCSRRYS